MSVFDARRWNAALDLYGTKPRHMLEAWGKNVDNIYKIRGGYNLTSVVSTLPAVLSPVSTHHVTSILPRQFVINPWEITEAYKNTGSFNKTLASTMFNADYRPSTSPPILAQIQEAGKLIRMNRLWLEYDFFERDMGKLVQTINECRESSDSEDFGFNSEHCRVAYVILYRAWLKGANIAMGELNAPRDKKSVAVVVSNVVSGNSKAVATRPEPWYEKGDSLLSSIIIWINDLISANNIELYRKNQEKLNAEEEEDDILIEDMEREGPFTGMERPQTEQKKPKRPKTYEEREVPRQSSEPKEPNKDNRAKAFNSLYLFLAILCLTPFASEFTKRTARRILGVHVSPQDLQTLDKLTVKSESNLLDDLNLPRNPSALHALLQNSGISERGKKAVLEISKMKLVKKGGKGRSPKNKK